MLLSVRRALLLICVGVGVVLAGLLGPSTGPTRPVSVAEAQPRAPRERPESWLKQLDPRRHVREGDALVADLGAGRRAVLTLDADLQEHVARYFARYEVPYAAVVAVEPSTGRVLAYVSHSSANPEAGDLALDPTPPAASVFKIITAAALVDAGVAPDASVCYHGGFERLTRSDLVDDPARDRQCATLADAVGGSINTIFAKLAVRHLDTATVERYAGAFGFGHALPFDVRTRPSPAEVPDRAADELEFARTSAGFWHTHMSPLHGALIGATFANDGRMPRAAIVDRVLDARGNVVLRHEPEIFRSVLAPSTAHAVSDMMENTVTSGTSRRAFHDPRGRPFLPGIRVAGKTGTLSAENPYRGYTWWVGFAPADRPTIALSALVVNTPRWRIKASDAAREVLQHYLVTLAAARRSPPSAAVASPDRPTRSAVAPGPGHPAPSASATGTDRVAPSAGAVSSGQSSSMRP